MPDTEIRDRLLAVMLEADTLVRVDLADAILAAGFRPPPRVLATAEAIAQERTGTVIRSRHGDIGSVDHGPHGEWAGMATLVHLLAPSHAMGLSVADLADRNMAPAFPWTVLHEPEAAR